MRVAVGAVVITLVALATAIILARSPREPPRRASAKPTYGQLARLVERISRDREFLEAQGVLLEMAGVGDGCAVVWLRNPTAPNVAYVQRRFPGTCVEPRPGGPIHACVSHRSATRGGPITVPDVSDLGLLDASRRVLAAGLTFTTTCLGRARNVEWVASDPEDQLVRVVAQCPRAGERVRRGTEVALQAQAVLPGGFRHSVGASAGCVDGRNPES
jgi:hypothetical protein